MFQLPTDDLFPHQWYLQNTGNYGDGQNNWLYRKGGDAKVVDAWRILDEHGKDWGAKNIKIAIIDGGFDLNNPDLKDKIVAKKDFDFGSTDYPASDPFELFEEPSFITTHSTVFSNGDHGTSCAGIALAANNGLGIVGVAPNAGFIPIVLKLNFFTNRALRKALQFAMEAGADVISCSLGLPEKMITYDIYRAIDECATIGRNGKGCIICFASGNDYKILPAGAIATHPSIIAVGATTSEDELAPYSNRSVNISVVAPGGFADAIKMVTTDVGYLVSGIPAGKGAISTPYYRLNAAGTSFACPLVAGIAALVLEANPALTAIEVKHILERTANKIGDARDYNKKGHSVKYGYGRVNAANAVLMALGKPSKQKYSKTFAPDISLYPSFSMNLGTVLTGIIPVASNGLHLADTIVIGDNQEGKNLYIEIETPNHLSDNECIMSFVQKDSQPSIMNGEHLAQSQFFEKENYTVLRLPNIDAGKYFIFVQKLVKRPLEFTTGGGEFSLTYHLEAWA